jgi:hypothetical protein
MRQDGECRSQHSGSTWHDCAVRAPLSRATKQRTTVARTWVALGSVLLRA